MNSPVKWHGGKHYLASHIVARKPKHTHYVETHAGGLSVLLASDPDGVSEVVNDIDGDLTNFWRVLQDPLCFSEFVRIVLATPFSEKEWRDTHRRGVWSCGLSSVDDAVAFFIHCRQSLAGRGKAFAPVTRTRTRRGMNEQCAAWLSVIEGLPAVHARLARVLILNRPALDVIRQQDGPDTLFYLDPPYLQSERASPDVYRHEMTEDDHMHLLVALRGIRGKFLLSGYRSEVYDKAAEVAGWTREDFELPNHAAGGVAKRRMTECIWRNF